MKNFFIVIALLLSGTMLFAQSPISFGIKVGVNSSKLTTDIGTYTEQFATGFNAGVFLRLGAGKFHIQPEAYYAVKGGKFSFDSKVIDPTDPGKSASENIKLSTLDIPIMLGYKIIDLKVVNARLQAGPVASIILNQDVSFKKNGSDFSIPGANSSLKDAIWGVQVGGGVDVLMFTLDVRYEFGLNDLSTTSGASTKSNMLNISLGYKIL